MRPLLRTHLFARRPGLLVAAAMVLGLGPPVGLAGRAMAQSAGARTIGLTMVDSFYRPSSTIQLRRGDRVKFVLRNRGKLPHEAVIGTPAEQMAHEKEMVAMGAIDANAMSDTPEGVNVKPGATKILTFVFKKAGKYEIACHQPNHYKAGMKVTIDVR